MRAGEDTAVVDFSDGGLPYGNKVAVRMKQGEDRNAIGCPCQVPDVARRQDRDRRTSRKAPADLRTLRARPSVFHIRKLHRPRQIGFVADCFSLKFPLLSHFRDNVETIETPLAVSANFWTPAVEDDGRAF